MNNPFRLTLLACALGVTLAFTGCDAENNALYKTTPAEQGVATQDSVQLPDGTLVPLTDELRPLVRPEAIIPAGTKIETKPAQVQVRPEAQAAIQALRLIPIPYADVIATVLTGALGIGATWINRKKNKLEAVAVSTIQGVDTFRDILEQTAAGRALDSHLIAALQQHQKQLKAVDSVNALLDRYRTPDKPTPETLNAEILAAIEKAGLLKPTA